jgi:lipid II:glycine glycyltransferase (peptidoglycan interpeptide bridge formation enzyme)
VWIDLTPTEDELMASFHKTARQNIRAPGKRGLVVRSITDAGAGSRLRMLLEQSFERTGARAPRVAWAELIEHASTPSASAHVAGLFREQDHSLREPLSFAVAFLHGDVAEYAHAGSLRDPSIKVSLLYSVAWELMVWARRRGATRWDFGGVPDVGDGAPDDLRAGIGSFKRYFSENVVSVGEEWVLEPRRDPRWWAMGALRPWRRP